MALAALVAVGGCDVADSERVCTLMGADSGVSVLVGVPEQGVTYRLCVGSSCTTGASEPEVDRPEGVSLRVALPNASAATVSAHFTATRGDTSVADERAEVTLKKFHPNGPRCDPTVYQASLDYRPGKGLVERSS